MTESRKVPIRNKTTGASSLGDPAATQNKPGKPPAPTEITPGAQSTRGASASHVPAETSAEEPRPEDPSAETGPADTSSPDEGSKKKHKRPMNETLDAFIRYAYARKGQRLALRPAEEKALCHQPRLDLGARDQLLEIAKDDLTLSVPRRLLLVFRPIVGYPTLNGTVRDFVRDVLLRHPAFGSPELRAAIKGQPEAPDAPRALELLAGSDFVEIAGRCVDKKLTPSQTEELRRNALYTLAAWFVETRGVSVEKLVQHLYPAVWEPAARDADSDTARLEAITELQELAGVGVVVSVFRKQADLQVQSAIAARREQERLQSRVESLTTEVGGLREQLGERDRRIAELEQTNASETREHEHTLAHLRDRLEQLRTRVLRRLKGEVELLTEGLHALRREPPKTHVMDDHAERALDGLRREIQELERES